MCIRDSSWAKICTNLYVLYMPDSSRCIVETIFIVNAIFQCSRHVIWKFQTTCSGSSRCSFQLRITQNSSSLVKLKCKFRPYLILNDFLRQFEKLKLSRIPTRWGCLETSEKCTIWNILESASHRFLTNAGRRIANIVSAQRTWEPEVGCFAITRRHGPRDYVFTLHDKCSDLCLKSQ